MAELIPIPSPGAPLVYGDAGDPAVVVLHDWYGRLPWLAPYAEALAQRGGFRVIVPDLYDGVATVDAAQAETLMDQLDRDFARAAVVAELDAARAAGSPRAGIVGFSLGGGLALQVAQSGEVDAAVAYYATLPSSQHGIIPCPVLLQFAESDDWPETGTPEAFVSRLRENGTPVTQHGYAGTVHGFANASIPAPTDTRAAALAFARTTTFLESHLAD
ncbi:dienelactone hydrolase family protein [Lysinimonas soli]|uniref:Dienelactone hydrolase family protein n=1 Tax=Lysinimonas soli TaxID=1074233 RepID=A0ABW0NSI6_9MICO